MATHHQQLKESGAGATVTPLLYGVAILIPLLVWSYGSGRAQLGSISSNMEFTMTALRVTTLTLASCLPLALPALVRSSGWRETFGGALLIVMLPLPLMTVLWMTGELPLTTLLLPFAALALIMMALAALLRLLAAAITTPPLLLMVNSATTVVVSGVAWALRDDWLGWLGL